MGTTMSPYGEPILAILLSRIGLMISVSVLPISDAVHCNLPRSALQPLPQCTATVLAVHCLFSRKYVQPWFSRYLVGAPMPQDWFYNSPRNIYRAATVPASTCV